MKRLNKEGKQNLQVHILWEVNIKTNERSFSESSASRIWITGQIWKEGTLRNNAYFKEYLALVHVRKRIETKIIHWRVTLVSRKTINEKESICFPNNKIKIEHK